MSVPDNTRHGHSKGGIKSPTYITWISMLQRCGSPTNSSYRYYGARGIKVCDRWLKFSAFLADMGPRPDGAQLDRVDSSGNYELTNCRWLDAGENRRRQSRCRYVEHLGQTKSVSQWAKTHGMRPQNLITRLDLGWSMEVALSTPVKSR